MINYDLVISYSCVVLRLYVIDTREFEQLCESLLINNPSAVNVHLDAIEQLDLLLLNIIVLHLPPTLRNVLHQRPVSFLLQVVVAVAFALPVPEDVSNARHFQFLALLIVCRTRTCLAILHRLTESVMNLFAVLVKV